MTYLENEDYKTPREKAVEAIYRALSASEHEDDHYGSATALLEELERRAIGFEAGRHGRILFCDPDQEPDFLENGSVA